MLFTYPESKSIEEKKEIFFSFELLVYRHSDNFPKHLKHFFNDALPFLKNAKNLKKVITEIHDLLLALLFLQID